MPGFGYFSLEHQGTVIKIACVLHENGAIPAFAQLIFSFVVHATGYSPTRPKHASRSFCWCCEAQAYTKREYKKAHIKPIKIKNEANRLNSQSRRVRGFSLIELLVVMVILGLLASLVGPAMFGKVDSSRVKTAQAQIQMLGTALDTFLTVNNGPQSTRQHDGKQTENK